MRGREGSILYIKNSCVNFFFFTFKFFFFKSMRAKIGETKIKGGKLKKE